MSNPAEIAALKRQLKIKSGAAKRLMKENGLYRKETEDLQRKLDKMIADGAESWDLKNAKRLVEESHKMVTDTSNRMGRAVGELRDVSIKAKEEPLLAADEDLLSAEAVLEEAAS